MPPTETAADPSRLRPVPEPATSAAGEPGRGGRWQPTRAGIINIWRYYDETFRFHGGRLLLRGANGTGKSKALELLLPFLFDANLQPSRLSTFGGTERTMHWNLMGDGYEGTNRVGYVWLEFGRSGDGAGAGDKAGPEWFTCGARLQASTNTRNVGVAYFTTDQRVDTGEHGELALVNAAGRPLTRKDLVSAIGARGEVHETAADYRDTVRHTLFPGFNQQRFDALITALLQLRTPKLSEHLDPAVLSTLLSRALPPLDQGDITEIAEGFERLDRQQQELRDLDGEVDAADRLAARQRTYAQRVLRAGAAALIAATSTMDGLTRKARESEQEHEATLARLEEVAEQDAALESEADQRSARIEVLTNLDSYREGRELERLRSELDTARHRAGETRRRADGLARRAEEDREKADSAVEDAARRGRHARQCRDDAEHAARIPGLTAAFEELDSTGEPEPARRLLRAAVDGRHEQIAEVRRVLATHTRAVSERTAAEQRLESARADLDSAEAAVERRRRDYDAELADLTDRLGTWAHACVELAADADALAGAAGDPMAVVELVNSAHGRAADAITRAEAGDQARRDALAGERRTLSSDREKLRQEADLPPTAPHTRDLDRATLDGAPLWRLVYFRPGVDAAVQAGVEAALEASGLLDAWMLPDGRMPMPGNDVFAEPDRTAPVSGPSLADVLECEPGAPVGEHRVRLLLERIAYGPHAPDHPAAVGADGGWRLAAAQGRWTKPEPAYIGATARERYRQRRIADLDGRIADLDGRIAAADTALDELARRRGILDEELARRPDHTALEEARRALRRAEADHAARGDAVARAETEVSEWEHKVAAVLHELTAVASERGLSAAEEALDQVAEALTAFRAQADAWLAARSDAGAAGRRADELVG
ncbi:TIGR02680 family protein, partial [Allosalinactinospora lopnorensis]|uniref:TIGR02680 family protein n=1 Tax=Allosalinactinospora lopnorensis TaxID=1352348 RepID=UPI0009E5D260